MKEITLITGNAGKAEEFSRLLGTQVLHEKIPLPELQATDVAVVANAKAEAAYLALQRPVFVDDTGLYISAWNNLPGALIAWFLDNVGNDGLIRMLSTWEDRSAKVITALGYCDEMGSRVFTGEVNGVIALEPIGENGFGYDPIFIPDGQHKTFAEMTATEKDAVSMRAIAAATMKSYFEQS